MASSAGDEPSSAAAAAAEATAVDSASGSLVDAAEEELSAAEEALLESLPWVIAPCPLARVRYGKPLEVSRGGTFVYQPSANDCRCVLATEPLSRRGTTVIELAVSAGTKWKLGVAQGTTKLDEYLGSLATQKGGGRAQCYVVTESSDTAPNPPQQVHCKPSKNTARVVRLAFDGRALTLHCRARLVRPGEMVVASNAPRSLIGVPASTPGYVEDPKWPTVPAPKGAGGGDDDGDDHDAQKGPSAAGYESDGLGESSDWELDHTIENLVDVDPEDPAALRLVIGLNDDKEWVRLLRVNPPTMTKAARA